MPRGPDAPQASAVVHRFFWMDGDAPCSEPFPADGLARALAFAEALRRRRRAGEKVSFVTIASEEPSQVGHAGVADPSPDYDCVKRRAPVPRRS